VAAALGQQQHAFGIVNTEHAGFRGRLSQRRKHRAGSRANVYDVSRRGEGQLGEQAARHWLQHGTPQAIVGVGTL
jgi:hypothetical protein